MPSVGSAVNDVFLKSPGVHGVPVKLHDAPPMTPSGLIALTIWSESLASTSVRLPPCQENAWKRPAPLSSKPATSLCSLSARPMLGVPSESPAGGTISYCAAGSEPGG